MEAKKKSRTTIKPLFVAVVCVICLSLGFGGGYLVFHASTATSTTTSSTKVSSSVLSEVISLINNNWVDSTNSKKSITSRMVAGLVDGLGDIHTTYMTADEISEFNNSINGDYQGIGVTFAKVNEGALITKIFDNTPASKAELKIGDIIIEAGGVSLKGKSSDKIKGLIRGKSGTSVTIKVQRGTTSFDKTIKRAALDTDVYYYLRKAGTKTFGYLQITTFGTDTASQVETALKYFKSKSVSDLVIDLRDNGGGYLNAADAILNLFNEKGQLLFSMKDKAGNETKYTDTTDTHYTFNKGYVLINGNTASASELTAGALSEIQGYTLVGTQSYGKGTAQTQATLSDSSVLKYTYAKWYTPKGKNIHGKGLTPDVKVSALTFDDLNVSSFTESYQYDQVNSHVKTMEIMLKALGYKPGRIDGYFSKNVQKALKAFQKDNQLSADGIYTKNVYQHLLAKFSIYLAKESNDAQYKKVLSMIQ